MKIVCIIPAHLASVRLKKKVLIKFYGLEMLEHVRRRVLISDIFDEVYVATGDEEIASLIESYGGNVVRTMSQHINGTSRVAEAIKKLDATHIVLVQGDEPLLLPSHLYALVDAMRKHPENDAWNATAPLTKISQLDKHSFVKCAVNDANNILYCFRRSPSHVNGIEQLKYIRKILGLIAYRREVLDDITNKKSGLIEITESIEQLKLISNNYLITSVPVDLALPSVNEMGDEEKIISFIRSDESQQKLLSKVLKEF